MLFWELSTLFYIQLGYLTIKESDESGYVLGFPNEETCNAFAIELEDMGKGLLEWTILYNKSFNV